MKTVDPTYVQQRVGEQLLPYFAQRNAVRRATPLFPWSLRALVQRLAGEHRLQASSTGRATPSRA